MIINATSIGLNKDDELNLDLKKVGNKKFFYDVIYSPSETNFLKNAKNQGNTSENGKLMFVYQALAAFKVWHGIQPEINDETLKLLDL
jgi:shikimate dehydrogenase